MSDSHRISRARFLTGAAAVGATAVAGPGLVTGGAQAKRAAPRRWGLTYRGIGYEVTDGEWPTTGWQAERMRNDIRVISDELHASSVSVFGTGPERLAATASEAAERGLHVWLQPRLGDRPRREILDHLAAAGEHAEEMRRQGAPVHLSVGAEFFLFVPGIVPGAHVLERIENLQGGKVDLERVARRLHAFIEKASKVGRSTFRGPLTYGAAQDDRVDWRLFDIVSVNYYSSFPRRSQFVRELRRYRRWGKPVAITEFGTCAYRGAPRRGGMAWDVSDYAKLVRSEGTQARYLTRRLEIFEAMGLYAALVYNFVSPDAPHDRNPRYDLDLASYGVVKAIWESRERPGGWRWEPKQAFHALARHYALAQRATRVRSGAPVARAQAPT